MSSSWQTGGGCGRGRGAKGGTLEAYWQRTVQLHDLPTGQLLKNNCMGRCSYSISLTLYVLIFNLCWFWSCCLAVHSSFIINLQTIGRPSSILSKRRMTCRLTRPEASGNFGWCSTPLRTTGLIGIFCTLSSDMDLLCYVFVECFDLIK